MKEAEYNRIKAVAYAHRWAMGRNPAYYDFSAIGGDCTSFASQCLFAGSGIMNFTPVTGWYYRSVNDRAPAWTSVTALYNFLVKNLEAGPYATELPLENAQPGDIIQLSFAKQETGHSLVAVEVTGDDILVAAHTFNCDNRPLSSYQYASARLLHIEEVRKK